MFPRRSWTLSASILAPAGENQTVRLNKLGGDQWQKAKAKAKAAAKDLAAGLIQLYAERKKKARLCVFGGFAVAEGV